MSERMTAEREAMIRRCAAAWDGSPFIAELFRELDAVRDERKRWERLWISADEHRDRLFLKIDRLTRERDEAREMWAATKREWDTLRKELQAIRSYSDTHES